MYMLDMYFIRWLFLNMSDGLQHIELTGHAAARSQEPEQTWLSSIVFR